MLEVTAEDYSNMCANCIDAEGHYISVNGVEHKNIAFMKWRDWMALVFASLVIGLYLANEVLSIKVCELILHRQGAIGAAGDSGQRRHHRHRARAV